MIPLSKLGVRIAYRPSLLRLSLVKVVAGKTLCSSNCHVLHYNKPCVQAVINCYQMKEAFLYSTVSTRCSVTEEGVLLEEKADGDLNRLVLTAHPEDFHKLPPKCSACGAIFQTKHNTQSGYIKETKLVESVKGGTLEKLICLNCYELRHHNTLLVPGVNSSDAMALLRHIRRKSALVLYVVDLFDIEGTVLQNILSLVGKKKRMIIVGNKIDRIPQDNKDVKMQLKTMKDVLKEVCFQNGLHGGNLSDICLVSAATGFGLKILLQKIMKARDPQMDVYLVGCTNTGKSTLYNLIVNLLNVHKSSDLPSQAIVHHIPGTTNSLVRAGISVERLERMDKRLKDGPWENEKAFDFDDELLDLVGVKKDDEKYKAMGMTVDIADKRKKRGKKLLGQNMSMLERTPLEFVDEKSSITEKKENFIYDTPGILNNSQIVQYLTPSEINYLSPSRWVVPRTVILKPGNCLFVGGLARLDYLNIDGSSLKGRKDDHDEDMECSESEEFLRSGQGIYVTAMVSPNVPIHVTITETADEKFEKLFSDNFLELPMGSPERFNKFPKLEESQYTVVGRGRNVNACDFALHGVGWLSISAPPESRVDVALHTPNGQGQSLRLNPLLPFSVQRKKGRGEIYQGNANRNMYGHTRKNSPQFVRFFDLPNDSVHAWQLKVKQKMEQDKLQRKEVEKLERLEQGIVLGKKARLKAQEEKLRLLAEQNHSKLLERKK